MVEVQMYEPVKRFLESRGYTVHAEVKGIDVTAVKDGEMILLELKTAFNLKLLYQALDRQKISDSVYLVIPRPQKANNPSFHKALYIAKKLGLGFITVAMDSPMKSVEVCLEAAGTCKIAPKRHNAVKKELDGRSMDGNMGGSHNTKLLTAFRERCIHIACALYCFGPMSASVLGKNHGCGGDTYGILYANHYGWFKKIGRGVYDLSEAGTYELEQGEMFREAVCFYMDREQARRADTAP